MYFLSLSLLLLFYLVIRNLLGTEPKLYDGDLGLPNTIEVQHIEEAVRLFKLGKN